MTHSQLDALINLIQEIVHERLNPLDHLAEDNVNRAEERLREILDPEYTTDELIE